VSGAIPLPIILEDKMPGRTEIYGNHIRGTDVSRWQQEVDWDKVYTSGIKFVIIKSSQELYKDKFFKTHRKGANDAGLDIGFYHFFNTDIGGDGKNQEEEALAQANYMLEAVIPLQQKEKWLALDLEKFNRDELNVKPSEESKERVRRVAGIFCNRLFEVTAKMPLLYVSPGTAAKFELGKSNVLTQCPLWVAHWGPKFQPRIPKGWSNWYMWQFGGDLPEGTIPGIKAKVDLNALNSEL
jgi:lysozyme